MKNFIRNNFYFKIYITSMFIGLSIILLLHTQPLSDFKYYYQLAEEIGNNLSFGNTYTSVGYSIILGYIFKITGSSLLIAKLFNLLLYSLLGLISYLILSKIQVSERKRKLIYGTFMLFPINLLYLNLVSSELIFTLLLMTLIYLYLFKDFKFLYIICGVIIGLGTIIKPFFIALPFVVLVFEIITKKQWKKPLKHLVITLVLISIVVAPIVYRNTLYNNEFTFVSNNGGIVLYINNNSENKLGRWMKAEDVNDSIVNKDFYINASMTEKNKLLSQEAKRWIKSHPVDFMILGVKRLLNTYLVSDDMFYILNGTKLNIEFIDFNQYLLSIKLNLSVYTIMNLAYVVVLSMIKIVVFLSALIYIVILTKKYVLNIFKGENLDRVKVLFLGIFYMFTIIYFITEGQGRYSNPLNFIMIYFFINIILKDNID